MPKGGKKQRKSNPKQTDIKPFVLWFSDISIKDVDIVGGKNASLGEMYRELRKEKIGVPNGFAITADAYWRILDDAGIKKEIKKTLHGLDVTNVKELKTVAAAVQKLIKNADIPKDIEVQVKKAYARLNKEQKKKSAAVVVRSSATAEDLPEASFAGQQESYLNVRGEKALLNAVKKCMASLFTERAISYRETRGYDHLQVALSVTVQHMVHASTGASGVMFTLDTESGFDKVVTINAAYGLGEYVVKGRVTPDQYYVFKPGLERNKPAIIARQLGSKEVKLVYGSRSGTKQAKVKKAEQQKFALSDDDVLTLAKWGVAIEKHYGRPQDIEWAKDGKTGQLFVVQARPETVATQQSKATIERYHLKKEGKVLARGTAVGQKIGAGRVRVIESPKEMHTFKPGDVLVTRITDPDWEPIMRKAAAIITEQGGKTSHAAIVSREMGVPCVVGVENARRLLEKKKTVTVSCAHGDDGRIFDGRLPFEVETIELKDIPKTKTALRMNVGDPANAFRLSHLPHEGIGLARLEFIFANFVKAHPRALLEYSKLKDANVKKEIRELTRGYKKRADYCVDKLADGMARIAAAAYPHPVVVRFSDFKTNEYGSLLGGAQFEPEEENPMLGWRGASRYYSDEYKPSFGLECQAMKRVREDYGLDNVIAMVPFCRTPEEGKKVLDTMAGFGLKQGENGLKVYVMCEIPSNVVLADDYAELFDGFSIGSNDLTQLMLGVDRDSAQISELYDESNPAIKKMIADVIQTAHNHGKPVSICGQAPSDSPDFVDFLIRNDVDSISLNPDALVSMRKHVAHTEKTVGKTGKRSNHKVLGLVSGLAVLAASMIALGAGCASNESVFDPSPQSVSDVSPAEIRQRTEAQVMAREQAEANATMATYTEANFADFELQYPARWSVNTWRGGVTLKNSNTDEFVSIYPQLVSHPIKNSAKTTTTIGGLTGVQYDAIIDGESVRVFEVTAADGKTLEISAKTDRLEDILKTFAFTSSSYPERDLNHWDIREKRVCPQVITYAKQGGEDQCQAFASPCDVPDNWSVCDADDTR